MPWSVFREWQSYYAIEPWGEIRNDISNAQGFAAVCSLVASGWAHKRVTVKPDDLMPKYGHMPTTPDTPQQAQQRWQRQKEALLMGARVGGLMAKSN